MTNRVYEETSSLEAWCTCRMMPCKRSTSSLKKTRTMSINIAVLPFVYNYNYRRIAPFNRKRNYTSDNESPEVANDQTFELDIAVVDTALQDQARQRKLTDVTRPLCP